MEATSGIVIHTAGATRSIFREAFIQHLDIQHFHLFPIDICVSRIGLDMVDIILAQD
jgi:hypothetical protein